MCSHFLNKRSSLHLDGPHVEVCDEGNEVHGGSAPPGLSWREPSLQSKAGADDAKGNESHEGDEEGKPPNVEFRLLS